MKKIKTLIIIIFCISIQSVSCQETSIKSTLEITDELTNKKFLGNGNENISGQKVGLWSFYCTETYYKDADIVMSGYYDENKRTGEWIYSYKSNGKLLLRANYTNGLLNGALEAYDDGKLDEKTEYLNGIKHGEQTEYVDESVYRKSIFKNDLEVLRVGYYYKSISPEYEYSYEVINENTKNARYFLKNVKVYWKNNQLMVEGNFNESGQFIDKWSVFYPSGSLFVSGSFSKYGPNRGSSRTSKFVGNGNWPNQRNISNFFNYLFEKDSGKGNKDGNWQYYYDDGNLFKSLNYKNGLQTGMQKYYHKNGNLKTVGMKELERGNYGYLRSFNIGVWESYDENGDLINVSYETFKKSGGYYSTYLNYEARYEDNVLRYEKKYPPGKDHPVVKEFNEQGLITQFYYGMLGIKFSYNQENNLTEKNISYRHIEKKEFFDTNGNIIGIKRIGDWSKITPEEYEKNVKILRIQDVEYDFRAEAKAKAEAEAKAKAEAEAEAEAKAKAKADAKAQIEAAVKAKAKADAKAKKVIDDQQEVVDAAKAKYDEVPQTASDSDKAKAKIAYLETKLKLATLKEDDKEVIDGFKAEIEAAVKAKAKAELELWYSSEKKSDFYLKQIRKQLIGLRKKGFDIIKIEIHRVPGNEDATKAFTFYYCRSLNSLTKLEQLPSENKSVNLYHKDENNLLLVFNAKK